MRPGTSAVRSATGALLVMLCAGPAARPAPALTLPDGGRSSAKVCIRSDAPPETAKAAAELAELGTGGLMMPVMIYAAGRSAPSEPAKDQKGAGYPM